MARKPVVFLSFANDEDAYLSNIELEEDQIYQKLQDVHDNGFIEIYNRGRSSIEDIFFQFTRFRDRIIIFHYGGHATGTHLQLQNQDANAKGLAKLMGQQNELKLVFLNGCSTLSQVKALQDAGVKAIIATSVPIKDNKARIFAVQFYDSLANGASLEQAFNDAVSKLETIELSKTDEIKIHRAIDLSFLKKGEEEDEIPWGLFVKNDKILKWTLPSTNKTIYSDPWVGVKIESQEVNKHIVLPVFEAISEVNPVFEEQLSFYRISKNQATIDLLFRQMMDTIIKHFPWPIGIKLRTLFSNHDSMIRKSRERLEQLISTYIRLSKFFLFSLLSQLWDELHKAEGFDIPENYFDELSDFLGMDLNGALNFSYAGFLGRITRVFDENQVTPFIEQLEGLHLRLEKEDGIAKAYLYFEEVRTAILSGNLEGGDLAQLCDKAEYSLGELLSFSAFLVDYKLVSIKDIGVSKQRRSLPLFKHQMGVLAGVAIEVMEGSPKDYSKFTDSHSILLVKGIDQVDKYVNLSPFLMDENAYKSLNAPKIYMYMFNREFEEIYYEHVDNDTVFINPQSAGKKLEMKSNEHENPSLVEELRLFRKDLLKQIR
ncbi:MAG: CHAT domain-containing protein [Bacteroidia bacterium]|nr:CHAT domain-containing protein [Bacteroidia bacterium]